MLFTTTRKKLSNLNVCLKSDHSSNDYKNFIVWGSELFCSKYMSYLLLNDFKLNYVELASFEYCMIPYSNK